MMPSFKCWRALVHALDHHVNVSGSTATPVVSRTRRARSRLVLAPHGLPALPEGGVVSIGLQRPDLPEILDPAVADGLADQPRQPGVGQRQPAARVTPLVMLVNFSGHIS